MASHPRVNINPAVLKWARDSAGFSSETAGKRLQVKEERYLSWEDPASELKPTIKQLRKISRAFHRPVSLFYLSEPPTGFKSMKDFRRLPGDGLLAFSPQLLFEMELAQQRRELSLELYISIGEEIEDFKLSATLQDDPEALGAKIRQWLQISYTEQTTWKRRGDLEPFKAWRRALEGMGVLVFQISRVPWQEVSGFAIAERQLPIVAVNRKDMPNRRTFGLLHEFVHILMKLSGASDLFVDATRPPEVQRVEVFCNRVAAATLIPRDKLLGLPTVQHYGLKSTDWQDDELSEIADNFGVSRIALLRRLLTFERTTTQFYRAKSNLWDEEFAALQERRRQYYKSTVFRKNPPVDVFYELGRPFTQLVLDSVRADSITLSEASGHFGNLRLRHFPKLEQLVYTG